MPLFVKASRPSDYVTLVLLDSFADLEKFTPAFAKALAETKLPHETGIVLHREYVVISEVPELRIEPPAPAAK